MPSLLSTVVFTYLTNSTVRFEFIIIDNLLHSIEIIVTLEQTKNSKSPFSAN